jgi:hypothetical protein
MDTITQEKALENQINFLYFTQNYPANWLYECFTPKGKSVCNHLQNKFNDLYQRHGSNAVVIRFMMELTDDNKKLMLNWITKNYNHKKSYYAIS